ncbi:MAG: hypothetical protein A2293_08805 [Elusimicrobia bacterium RIFOXYB2_FULL_49_7]|nr:MAG: hypothetical protein A2293_08805 [Elusimicrobia bacterium RIFOXYB2_FULL_49_7]
MTTRIVNTSRFLAGLIVFFPLILSGQSARNIQLEQIEKERAVLEMERKALDEEISRLAQDKNAWEQRKRAEEMLRQRETLDDSNVGREWRIKNTINRVLSDGLSDFLHDNGCRGTVSKIILLSITIHPNGKVIQSSIVKSDTDNKTAEKALALCRKLDFSGIKELGEPYRHLFPLRVKP